MKLQAMLFRRIDEYMLEDFQMPWWMGMAWRCPERKAVVCMPLVVNVLASWARWAYYRLRYPRRQDLMRLMVRTARMAYGRGYEKGLRDQMRTQGYWFVERSKLRSLRSALDQEHYDRAASLLLDNAAKIVNLPAFHSTTKEVR